MTLSLGGALRSSPLRSLKSGLRDLRDYLHYRPLPGFRPRQVVKGGVLSHVVAKTLQERGICILENFLDAEQLRVCQAAFDALFVDSNGAPAALTDLPGTYSRVIDCTQYPAFLDLVVDELVLAAFEEYYARPVYVAMTQANRLDSVAPFEGDSYQWHHDTKGKYVKAMWLLTDVRKDGQRMSYIAGSHTLKHHATAYAASRFRDADARALGEVVECVGPPGSVVLFDTNGIHRGNRNWGPRRDVLFGVYSAGRYRLGCQYRPEHLGQLSVWQHAVLKRSQRPSRDYR